MNFEAPIVKTRDKKDLDLREEFLTTCPSCGRISKSKYKEHEGYVYLIRYCDYDKIKTTTLISKGRLVNRWLVDYAQAARLTPKEGQYGMTEADVKNISNVNCVIFNLTEKCNSTCSICYNRHIRREDMSIELVKEKLKLYKNHMVYLFGGEPTVRADLPQIIREVKKSGNTAVLFTNGLKLASKAYVQELVNAGLDSVDFSFDGYDKKVYNVARGGEHELLLKIRALENLKKARIPVKLQVTVIKHVNDNQLKNIFKLAMKNPVIYGVQFKQLSLAGVEGVKDLDKENILSDKELRELVYASLGNALTDEDMFLQTRVIINSQLLMKRFGLIKNVNSGVPGFFVQKKSGKIRPIISAREAREINMAIEDFSKGKLARAKRMLKKKYLKLALRVINFRMLSKQKPYFDKLLRVTFCSVTVEPDRDLREPLNGIEYMNNDGKIYYPPA